MIGTVRRLTLCALGLVLGGCAHAAQLAPGCTVPTVGNAGSCGAFVAGQPLGGPVSVHFRWYPVGASPAGTVETIPNATPGQSVRLAARVVPEGSYVVVAWASNAIGAGCADSITVVAGNAPAKASTITAQ